MVVFLSWVSMSVSDDLRTNNDACVTIKQISLIKYEALLLRNEASDYLKELAGSYSIA